MMFILNYYSYSISCVILAARGDQVVTDFKRVRLLLLSLIFFFRFFLEAYRNIYYYYFRKLNGVGLDDMSFTELASLGSMLDEGFRIVDEQLDNVVGVFFVFSNSSWFDYSCLIITLPSFLLFQAHEEITTKQVKIIILSSKF